VPAEDGEDVGGEDAASVIENAEEDGDAAQAVEGRDDGWHGYPLALRLVPDGRGRH
jgi:hypothetical protein